MKKRLLIILVILIFLVGSIGVYGIPKKGKTVPSSTAGASGATIELDDGYRISANVVGSFLKSVNKCQQDKKNCWEVVENKVIAYNNQGKKVDLDRTSFWETDVGVDDHGNLYDKSGNLYSDNGLVEIKKDDIPKNLVGKVGQIGGKPVIPMEKEGKKFYLVGGGTDKGVELSESEYNKIKGALEQGIDSVNSESGQIVLKEKRGSITKKEDMLEIKLKDGKGKLVMHEIVFRHGESLVSQTIEQKEAGKFVVDGENVYGEYDANTGEGIFYSDKEKTELVFGLTKDDKGNFIKGSDFEDNNPNKPTKITITASDGSKIEQELEDRNVKSQEHYNPEGWLYYEADFEDEEGFFYSKDGTIIGVSYGDKVIRTIDPKEVAVPSIYVSEDGEYVSNELTDSGRTKLEKGLRLTKDDLKNPKSEDEIEEDNCGGMDCTQAKKALDDRDWQRFNMGETAFAETVSDFVSSFRPYSFIGKRLDSWVGGLFFGYSEEWMEGVDKYFARYIGVDYWVSDICKAFFDVEPEGAVYIETPDGLFELVASAQGETTYPEAVEMLCDVEGECDEGICREGFCYEDEEATEPIKEYFYKIEYGIRAPGNPKFTPGRPTEQAVVFNIKLICDSKDKDCKDFWIYKDNATKRLFYPPERAIKLKNGENHHMVRVSYSSFNYQEICIIWDAAPKDRYGDTAEDYCQPIEKASLRAFENTEKAGRPRAEPGKEAYYDGSW